MFVGLTLLNQDYYLCKKQFNLIIPQPLSPCTVFFNFEFNLIQSRFTILNKAQDKNRVVCKQNKVQHQLITSWYKVKQILASIHCETATEKFGCFSFINFTKELNKSQTTGILYQSRKRSLLNCNLIAHLKSPIAPWIRRVLI